MTDLTGLLIMAGRGGHIGDLMTDFYSNMSISWAEIYQGVVGKLPRAFPGKVLVMDSALFPDQVMVPFKTQLLANNVDFSHVTSITVLGVAANGTSIHDALNHPFTSVDADAGQPYGIDQWRAHFTRGLITKVKIRWAITPQNQTDDTDSWDTSAFSGCHFIVEPIELSVGPQIEITDNFQRLFFQNQYPALSHQYIPPYDQGDGGQKGSEPTFIVEWENTPWYILGITQEEYFENADTFSSNLQSSTTDPGFWAVRLHVTTGNGLTVGATGKMNCTVLAQVVFDTLMYDPINTAPSSTGQT